MNSERAFSPGKGTLLAILIASMTITMGGAAVAPALPLIQEAFPDAGETVVSLVISLPSLGVAVAGFPMGALADRWGKSKTLMLSAVIFVVAGVSAMFLDDIVTILVGRFLLGVGIAGITLCTTALISEYWHGPETVRVLGLQSAAMGVGIICLETGGGALADIGWREPFIVYAVIGIPIMVLTAMFVREPGAAVRAADAHAETTPAHAGMVVAMSLLMIFVIELAFFMYPSKIAYYLQEIDPDVPSVMSGLFLGIAGLANAVVGLLQHRIFPVLKRSGMFALIGTLFLAAGVLMLLQVDMATTCVSMILAGSVMGLVVPTIIGWLSTISNARNSGKVMGLYSVVMNLGMFSASFVMLPIADATGGYDGMYMTGAIAVFVLGIAYLAMRGRIDGRA